jgi:hypothetical protein
MKKGIIEENIKECIKNLSRKKISVSKLNRKETQDLCDKYY